MKLPPVSISSLTHRPLKPMVSSQHVLRSVIHCMAVSLVFPSRDMSM